MTDGPWVPGQAPVQAGKRHAPATTRNRDAIVTVLADTLPERGTVLEIASGSGEHVVHFAQAFPALHWQPSDADSASLGSIGAWLDDVDLPNVAPPLLLDAGSANWPTARADAIVCINMVHISPWDATLGLLHGAARLLPAGAPLYLYGPYVQPGVETADSNLLFDRSLRDRDPAWGLRSTADVEAAAARVGLWLDRIVSMPANNLSLIFRTGPRPG